MKQDKPISKCGRNGHGLPCRLAGRGVVEMRANVDFVISNLAISIPKVIATLNHRIMYIRII